jgi:2-polyprenyl-3-methyl-5-hydroxy-6-metoxy-1,4-benzoquinol methylase
MNYVVCNLCGADDWRIRFQATESNGTGLNASVFRCTSAGYGRHCQIVQCRRCDHVYANPRWSSDELIAAYAAVEDETYIAERSGRERTFAKHLRSLQQVTGPAAGRSLLDVGAYTGVFVEVALAAGWQACGVEPSRWATTVAQREGLPVIEGTQDSPDLQGRQFDAVTMWDVIEHVSDPSAELARAFQLLRPGGVLAVHTMDIDSLAARLMGARWPWLMNMHIHYFSRKTLTRMLARSGFEIVRSGAEGRYLRLGYLGTRVEGLSPILGRLVARAVRRLRLAEVAVPVNFGDLFTVYARRPGCLPDHNRLA